MVKKKKFWKNLFRQLKSEYSRFISMIGIVLLGVGIITGLIVTTPNMQTSISDYYIENNTADIFMKSSIGFNIDSDSVIEGISNIRDIEPMNVSEMKVTANNANLQSVVYNMDLTKSNRINKLKLLEGKMNNLDENEILVEQSDPYYIYEFKIGDKVKIKDINYTVAGIVSNSWYFSKESETTLSGAEKLQAIIYKQITDDIDTYTDIFITVDYKNGINNNAFLPDYKDATKLVIEDIKFLQNSLMTHQKDFLIQKINNDDTIPEPFKQPYIDAINDLDEDLYVLDRNANASFQTFDEFASKVDAIAKIFPVFFLLVASLVVLTTMTRLVEEERLQIGILRGLGYSKKDVYLKYIIYALIVGVIGTGLGYLAGFRLLPIVIYQAFENSFFLPKLNINVYSTANIIVIVVMILSILFTTILAVRSTLKENPANLLRPRAPKQGKRILLERIPFIWKRLKFKYKSSLRNVFRYPKHLLMTVLGVAGSLALVFTGFGLNNSIKSITNVQYEELFHYDLTIHVDSKKGIDNELNIYLQDNYNNQYLSFMQEGHFLTSHDDKETFIIDLLVIDDTNKLDDFITLRNRKTKDKLDLLDGGVIITEQISKYLKLKVGDTFTINGQNKDLKVIGITENYINSKIYMTKSYYDLIYGLKKDLETDEMKSRYVANKIVTNKNPELTEDFVEAHILLNKNAQGVDFASGELASYERLLDQINIIVIILVGAAGMLAVIVIYNLANVNISEREKEIATLKVLGYKQSEVSGYIFREIIMMTLMGIIVGLGLGFLMHLYIVSEIDTPTLMMGRDLRWYTYVISIGATLLFTFIVQFLMYFKIKKIDMIEAMKEV